MEIETMESMAKRLAGCGASEQVKAVIKAIAIIKKASGYLDKSNRVTALIHLSEALSGKDHAVDTLIDAAFMFEMEMEEKNA